jgi:hypothetical protein
MCNGIRYLVINSPISAGCAGEQYPPKIGELITRYLISYPVEVRNAG